MSPHLIHPFASIPGPPGLLKPSAGRSAEYQSKREETLHLNYMHGLNMVSMDTIRSRFTQRRETSTEENAKRHPTVIIVSLLPFARGRALRKPWREVKPI